MLKRKIMYVLLSAAVIAAFLPAMTAPVSAWSISDYADITKNPSYTNKDGLYCLSFTTEVTGPHVVYVWAKLFYPSGKSVCTWSSSEYGAWKSGTRGFGKDYSDLPSGKYTFRLYFSLWQDYYDDCKYMDYTITHTAPEASVSFKSYETYYDSDGYYMHKFNIQCKNLKGKAMTIKIYDSDGYLVYQMEGIKRETNNEVGFFGWSGYSERSAYGAKYPSGSYTVTISAPGAKTIEKTYSLKILEKPRG